MCISDKDKSIVIEILLKGTTKDAQDYLIKTYNVERNKTSNLIKRLRTQLGIYKSIKKDI